MKRDENKVYAEIHEKILKCIQKVSSKGNRYMVVSYFFGESVETDMIVDEYEDVAVDACGDGKECRIVLEITRGKYPRYTIVEVEPVE